MDLETVARVALWLACGLTAALLLMFAVMALVAMGLTIVGLFT